MKNLKAAFLTPRTHVQKVQILGVDVNIRRMTASELLTLEEEAMDLNMAGKVTEASLKNVEMILSCIVDDEGKKLPKGELPTAKELLDIHDNASLIDAISIVKRHSVGTLEEAKKN
ncbi:phage tail protein [Providencia heimbachae]|uniref:phage tail protein n=1 Tax=Providencia heimbachae TaxID=333962 RepID=UPI00224023F0|nr:phage tail protein [Providencia heimbachae]